MNDIESMQIFVRVAELASFTQAAKQLGLPNATVSSAVQQLERTLGTRLLHRTTRKVQMTQDGQVFYTQGKDLLEDFNELKSMFRGKESELSGRLRVDMPLGIAKHLVMPELSQFLQMHPQLHVELSTTDHRVDLVREGFDCVLRIGVLDDSSLVAKPLGRFRMINCVSPDYLNNRNLPTTSNELAVSGLQLIHYDPAFKAKPLGWEYWDGKKTRHIPMPGVLTVNNTETYRAACISGLGVIQAPAIGVQQLVTQGQLVEILPEFVAEPMPVSLLYGSRRHVPARAQEFMNWLARIVRKHTV